MAEVGLTAVPHDSLVNHLTVQSPSQVISVSLDHDVCCCAGLSRSGTEVKQIPLEQITDLVIDEQGQGWIQRCVPQVNPHNARV